jgi:hypothetical protein
MMKIATIVIFFAYFLRGAVCPSVLTTVGNIGATITNNLIGTEIVVRIDKRGVQATLIPSLIQSYYCRHPENKSPIQKLATLKNKYWESCVSQLSQVMVELISCFPTMRLNAIDEQKEIQYNHKLLSDWTLRDLDSAFSWKLAWIGGDFTAAKQNLNTAIEHGAINKTAALHLSNVMEKTLLPYADLDLIQDMSTSERIDLLSDVIASMI